jgi:hypothetical protein
MILLISSCREYLYRPLSLCSFAAVSKAASQKVGRLIDTVGIRREEEEELINVLLYYYYRALVITDIRNLSALLVSASGALVCAGFLENDKTGVTASNSAGPPMRNLPSLLNDLIVLSKMPWKDVSISQWQVVGVLLRLAMLLLISRLFSREGRMAMFFRRSLKHSVHKLLRSFLEGLPPREQLAMLRLLGLVIPLMFKKP